ncbi:MAG TPA: ATPase domain-containing protein [Planctomycetota bacterium]
MKRLSTGVRGLDEILSGGIPLNAITVLMGSPGTGKSILAEQIAFAGATKERPALYLTTYSEPLEKFIANSQAYAFFESAKVGVEIQYEDLGQTIREHGFASLPKVVAELIAQRRPSIVIIDSFKALCELGATPQESRTVLFDLATVLSNFDCTTFLVGEYASENLTELPVFAVADCILSLQKHKLAGGEQRFLRVEKMRGSAFVPGLHAFSIAADGLEVFPRLLTPPAFTGYAGSAERLNTGVEGLDVLVEEGILRGSTTVLAGPTGSGKTMLGLQFLNQGLRAGEAGLLVGFQENPVQLLRVMKGMGWDPNDPTRGGLFEFLYRSPVEMQLDEVALRILERVRTGKVKRVVIDALGDLKRRSVEPGRFADYVYALTQWFALNGVTCLMAYELRELFEFHSITGEEVSNMADNILLLRFTPGATMERTLRVVKTRGSGHDQREHRLLLSKMGVAVGKPWEGEG